MVQVETNNLVKLTDFCKHRYAGLVLFGVLVFVLSACGANATVTPFIAPHSPTSTPTPEFTAVWTNTPEASSTPEIITATPLIELPEFTATPEKTATTEPTIEPTIEPTSEGQSACTDAIQYIQDTTYPDNSSVIAGQAIEKQWLVENTGDCNWDSRYSLKLIEGYSALGATTEVPLFSVPAGTQVNITINFSAPYEAGIYQTAWQAYNPQGLAFGLPIYMLIQVEP